MLDALQTALRAAEAADQKKAFDIVVLDLRGLTYFTDYFVICSCGNVTQVSAVAEEIGRSLAKEAVHPDHVEGGAEATWVLMDYGDVVVHIFEEQARLYYHLDRLWGDAPKATLPEKAAFGASS